MRSRKKRAIAATPLDPTAAGVPVVLAGQTYHLCFDLGALAEAENYFIGKGHDVNLLAALPVLNIHTVLVVFPCALHRFHPDITWEAAQAMVTLETMYIIGNAIAQAWMASSAPKPKDAPANPLNP